MGVGVVWVCFCVCLVGEVVLVRPSVWIEESDGLKHDIKFFLYFETHLADVTTVQQVGPVSPCVLLQHHKKRR